MEGHPKNQREFQVNFAALTLGRDSWSQIFRKFLHCSEV
jgi:hypothetical protein